jgi:mannose-6-phosphate isomerase-like protein (cupin superfamily)
MPNSIRKRLPVACLFAASCLFAADPTFVHRRISDVQPQADDLTASAPQASYKPLYGAGDPAVKQWPNLCCPIIQSVARYGELTVQPNGTSAIVSYAAEEQIYYILDGNGTLLYGDEKVPVKKDDFMYLPVNVKHGMANSSNQPVRLLVMGYKIPEGTTVAPTPKLMLANANDAKLQILRDHGPTAQFKLLMGTAQSKRDMLPAANIMSSLFIMDFAPGGTNIPHHHDREEEIYYVLRGQGDMVAGGGTDGNEGRYPAKEGDAYFFRLNATVGFYSGAKEGEPHPLVLAVRSRYPFQVQRPRSRPSQ